VTTEQTGGRGHHVIERSVQEEFGDGDSLTVLLDGDLDLRGRQSDRLHTHTFSQLRTSLVDLKVVVAHEVDRQTGLDTQFSLLDGKLLKAQNRHSLKQDLLRPNLLNGGGEGGIGRVASGGHRSETSTSNRTTCGGGKGHGFILRGIGLVVRF
jgi:hypothetical protein